MKVSILTPVLNAADTVADCIESVAAQTHPDVEHIVIDGGSTDGTAGIVAGHKRHVAHWQSGPDRGIFDALNKGIEVASGDVIGVLGADDVYAGPRVLQTVCATLTATGCDSCYGDLVYVARSDLDRVVRYWVSGEYRPGGFRSRGCMPPHSAFFVRRDVPGCRYDATFRISGCYELMLRLLERRRISTCYVPEVLVRMRTGGVSNRSLRHIIRKSAEDCRAWRVNGLPPSLFTLAMKNLSKLPQFVRRRPGPGLPTG